MNDTPLLVISGPTACGKSALAVALCRSLNGEVVNADSVQVYRELSIGSGKISETDKLDVPHHLLDVLDPTEQSTVGWFRKNACDAISAIRSRQRHPVICGGTTLYIKALLMGLAELPIRNEELREELGSWESTKLHSELCAIDPVAAQRIHPHDRIRMIRSIELYRITGKSESEIREDQQDSMSDPVPALCIIPIWDRQLLYSRIDRRVEEMFADGLEQEVRDVCDRYGAKIPGFKTIGYREFIDGQGLRAELPEVILREIQLSSRRYAKRQMTFWRNEPRKSGWRICPTEDTADRFIGDEAETSPLREIRKGFPVLELTKSELEDRVREYLSTPSIGVDVWYLNAAKLLGSSEETGFTK